MASLSAGGPGRTSRRAGPSCPLLSFFEPPVSSSCGGRRRLSPVVGLACRHTHHHSRTMNEENRRGARAQAPERRGARAQAPGAAHDAAENAVSLPPPACREGRRPRLVEQERRRRRRARNPATAGHHAPPATPARCAQPGHRGSPQGAGGHHTSPCGTTTERDEHPVRRPLSAGVAARRARQAIGTWEAGRAQRPGRDGGVGGQHLNHARRDHCSICLAHSSSPPPPPPSWWGGTTAPPIASAPVLAPPPPPCGGRRAVASA